MIAWLTCQILLSRQVRLAGGGELKGQVHWI